MGQVVEPAEFFVVRVPALPFSTLTDWSAGVEAPRAAAADLDEALARDRVLLGSRLGVLAVRADVAGALFVASPDVVRATSGTPSGAPKAVSARAQTALVRYLSRMASRPTPFGLFAGCGVGTVGPTTSLSIPPAGSWRRNTTLDGGYLEALRVALCASPELRDRLTVRPNGTITRVAGRLRLVRWRSAGDASRHHVVEVRPTPKLERALDAARLGACVPDIAAAVAAPGPPQSPELDFVRALVEAQILVTDLQLQLTGAMPLDALIADLEDVGAVDATAELLRAVSDALGRLDDSGVADPGNPNAVADLLAQLGITTVPEQPCHVILSLPRGDLSLAATTAGDIERGAQLLARIAPVSPPNELAEFRVAFGQRYGRREVSLTEALDDRIGVGFGTTPPDRAVLLDGLPPDNPAPLLPFTRRDAALLELVLRAAESRSREVDLTSDDIDALAAESPRPLPASFTAAVSLANTARGPRILFNVSSGPSGMQLLGRFCHADPDLAGLVRRHLHAEAALDPEAVFAEIVHHTGGAAVNYLARPLLREWEIEWLGRSGAPAERRLPVSDLLVSVSGDRVVLRSRRLGQRVVPRLTTAHNWTHGTPAIYRFLCSLQAQDCAGGLYWDWGALASAKFLPRVRWGRLVFERARWLVAAAELEHRDGEPWRAVQAIRAGRGLPRWVVVAADDDNELTVDLDNVLGVESLARLLRKRGSAVIKEMFPGPDELVAQGANGPYTHELLLPFITKPGTATKLVAVHAVGTGGSPPAPDTDCAAESGLPRISAPCGEWVVLELNSGTALADRLLLEMVAPLLSALLADGATDCWYFTRSNGRSPCITMHAHGDPDLLIPAMRGLAAKALAVGTARDASFRTHVQRAGTGQRVSVPTPLERLAQADSTAALELVSMLGPGDRRQDDRWRVCLVGVDRWLCDVGLNLDQRLAHATLMSGALAQDHWLADGAAPRLGERFRVERLTLSRLLGAPEPTDPLAPCIAVLDRRSALTVPIITELADAGHPTQDRQTQQELAAALAHGWINRVMRSRDRAHEWAISELLRRFYEASVHRRSAQARSDSGAARR